MKLKGQMGECPRRFLKFLRKIRTAVAFTRSVFLTWASIIHINNYFGFHIYIFGKSMSFRYFVISFRDFVVSWFTNSPFKQMDALRKAQTHSVLIS